MIVRSCIGMRLATFVLVIGAFVACSDDDTRQGISSETTSSDGPRAVADSSAALFAPDHLIEVRLELNPDDWQALRVEGRSLIDGFLGLFTGTQSQYEYTKFGARAFIDGESFEQVTVRKKGFLGSLSMLRPSLKLKLGGSAAGGSATRRMTLNNDKQDPSHTHQCMAYGLFAKAGVPAPRCNHAHVVVNGEDLGTYSHVETIDEPMLSRHFPDPTGNLYEASAGGDFVDSRLALIESQNNEDQNDRSDLRAVAAALTASDEELPKALGAIVDVDRFRDFWALETLMGHWDSYSGNASNYYAYHDPTSGRFVFLPWGTDGAFEGANPFDPGNRYLTVYAKGRIANRLYGLPEEQSRFRERLAQLNAALWDEPTLLGEVDRIAQLAPDASQEALEQQRAYVKSHGVALRAALTEPAPAWKEYAEERSACFGLESEVVGTFRTSFGDLATLAPGVGDFTLQISLDGRKLDLAWFGKAGLSGPDAMTSGSAPAIRYVATLADGRTLLVQLDLAFGAFAPGDRPFHGDEIVGVISVLDKDVVGLLGVISDGALQLEQAAAVLDAPVAGSFSARVGQLTCLN